MIYFIDDFLDNNLFEKTTEKLNSSNYTEYKTPGKSFWVQEAEPEFNSLPKPTEDLSLEDIAVFSDD